MSTNKFIKLCDYNIYSGSKSDCLDMIFSMNKVHVISGNPEVLYTSFSDTILSNNFKSKNSIIIPDGIGVKLAARLKKLKINEKIAGIELMVDICKLCADKHKSIYLLGASDESVLICSEKLKEMFPNLIVAGIRNGYFSKDDTEHVVDDILSANPDVLFVALGCPKQEHFIISCFDKLPTSIFMGVGGSFDVISGFKKRAPKILIKMGLEWLYRVYKEPFRIKRLSVIPKFLVETIKK